MVLDPRGRGVAEQGSWEHLRAQEGFVSKLLPTSISEDDGKKQVVPTRDDNKPLPKAVRGPSANDVADLTRQIGDVAVYKYYFASIGWKLTLQLLVTISANTVATTLLRKYLYSEYMISY